MMYFSETHEWVTVDGDTAVVGITDYAQRELGDIVYIELPRPGAQVQAGQEVCVLESTKSAADVYSPLSGTVTEVNEALNQKAELVNQDAEGGGWLYKLTMSDPGEVHKLLQRADYDKIIA